MSLCIYCLKESSASVSVPHAIPEAILKNDRVLPIGAVCDACNLYFGQSLEPVLIAHPLIALAIQTIGAPGKRGKSRVEIAKILHQPADDPNALIRGPIVILGDRTGDGGIRRVKLAIKPDSTFKMPAFRRALHYVGFNVMALENGVDYVLDKRWNAVRRYIRAPSKGMVRDFAQLIPNPSEYPHIVNVALFGGPNDGLARLDIFGNHFVVDLLETGRIQRAAHDEGFEYFGPKATEPTTIVLDAEYDPNDPELNDNVRGA